MCCIRSNFSNGANYARDLTYKKNHPVTTKQVVTVVDLGYLGVKMISRSTIIALSCKKKRNQQGVSEEEEKEYNKIHSNKKRIVIVHTICRLKKYRIMSDIFRNKLQKYNKISDIVAGLINYKTLNH